jgi:hypothetical protein
MALRINNKAGIVATFAAIPELKAVYLDAAGNHHFSKHFFEVPSGEYDQEGNGKGVLPEDIVMLAFDAPELTMTEKEQKDAFAARQAAITPA